MRAALLVMVLALGCSNKKAEPKQEPAPAAKPEPTKPPEDKPAEVKPSEPVAEVPTIDCNTIITAADIEKACGTKVEIHAGKQEGSGDMFTCQRTISEPGKKFPIAYWFVRAAKRPADVAGIVKLEKLPEAKTIEGLGEEAWSSEHEEQKLKTVDYDVNVRKGHFLLKVSSTKGSLNKKPPCTLDQMVEVAKIGTSRLP